MVTKNLENWRSPKVTCSIYWILTRKIFINTPNYMIAKLYWVLPEPLKKGEGEGSHEDYLPACPFLLCKGKKFHLHFYGVSKDFNHYSLHICAGEELGVKEEFISILVMSCSLMRGRHKMEYHIIKEGADQELNKDLNQSAPICVFIPIPLPLCVYKVFYALCMHEATLSKR